MTRMCDMQVPQSKAKAFKGRLTGSARRCMQTRYRDARLVGVRYRGGPAAREPHDHGARTKASASKSIGVGTRRISRRYGRMMHFVSKKVVSDARYGASVAGPGLSSTCRRNL